MILSNSRFRPSFGFLPEALSGQTPLSNAVRPAAALIGRLEKGFVPDTQVGCLGHFILPAHGCGLSIRFTSELIVEASAHYGTPLAGCFTLWHRISDNQPR